MANEKRLIDANALGIGKAKREAFNNPAYADGWNSAIDIIENAPTIDAVPVVHGRWKAEFEYEDFLHADCSVCGKRSEYMYNYCPNCGAKME